MQASLEAPCSAARLFTFVDDLAKYPEWMTLTHRVEALPGDGNNDGDQPAWQVELRARVGPLARSKRLRMQRTEYHPDEHRVVFERVEADGRRHSPWVLRAQVLPRGDESTLHMHLHYGGALWTGGVLEGVLGNQITDGRERLVALTSSTR